ncbi:E3 ubiquitin-protein ligase RNF133-like [Echinops telfairi]|uniref:E3 ubiquitin-protein ligase RNF133-like n=1 Tax=Echinops telfairi TaxID=9371 RepID=A0ABM0IXF4_ECHTE|nr:E3 ubiquitin-protein ligase RNF133-like [Echinops telfairi]
MRALKLDARRINTISWFVRFTFLLLLTPNSCSANAVWTAYINMTFYVGDRMLSELGETGIFGKGSALKKVSGIIVPPDGKTQHVCHPNTNFSLGKGRETWFALIERGGCNFTQKIQVAVDKGASGVIIYNFAGTGNQVFPMSHQAFTDIVVVMIGNLKGSKIFRLIQKGIRVTAIIEVGRRHVIFMNHYLVSFAIVIVATIAYFIFYQIRKNRMARIQNRRWQELIADLKDAFGQLQLRVLKEGDEEITPNGDNCVICFEPYKADDIVRILTCKHFFHKDCIDPWILSHGTCPMCKCDILKALGIQLDAEYALELLQEIMLEDLNDSESANDQETNNEVLSATPYSLE